MSELLGGIFKLIPHSRAGFLVVAVVFGLIGFVGVQIYRGIGPAIPEPTVVPTSPSPEAPAAPEVPAAPVSPSEVEGLPIFSGSLRLDGNTYWPQTIESQYQPGVDKGLGILCYQSSTDSVRSFTNRFPNGMSDTTPCAFFRIYAYSYSAENIAAVSDVQPHP